jgi:hypothetical protein
MVAFANRRRLQRRPARTPENTEDHRSERLKAKKPGKTE